MLVRPQHSRNTSRDMGAIATSSCTHETKQTPIMTEDYVTNTQIDIRRAALARCKTTQVPLQPDPV